MASYKAPKQRREIDTTAGFVRLQSLMLRVVASPTLLAFLRRGKKGD